MSIPLLWRPTRIAFFALMLLAHDPRAATAAPIPAPLPVVDRARPGTVESLGDSVSLFPFIATGGYFGWGYSVSGAGDVNGDGYADFLASNGTVSPWGTYAVVLYNGSASGPVQAWTHVGYSKPVHVSAAGDVNGDGYDDVIIGLGDLSGAATGIEVFYGSAGGLPAAPSFASYGGAAMGWSVCAAGDVKGDGYDDVIVGDPLLGSGGRATIFNGSATGLSSSAVVTLDGSVSGGRYGSSVAGLGDVNGDGYADVGVGSGPNFNQTTAAADVYLGGPAGPALSASFSKSGEFSALVAPAGDVNGDGYADYFVGDPLLSTPPGNTDHFGVSNLVLGGPLGPIGGWSAVGSADDYMGVEQFTAGDVNGDGLADVLYASQPFGLTAQVQLALGVLGQAARPESSFPILSYNLDSWSMRPAGDVNGDGFGDVVFGIPASSRFSAGSGEIRVRFGRADAPGGPAAERFGGQAGAVEGWSVALGDVNGDGFDDVLVGKPLENSGGFTDNGQIELFLGGQSGIAATPTWAANGLTNDANMGISVSLGQDVNGDGYGDVVVGAHHADQVYVWYGRADWSTATGAPDQVVTSPKPGVFFGASVAQAGDVNGDGFADVVVGAYGWETITGAPQVLVHHPQAGIALLYRGSPSGLTFDGWFETDDQDFALEGLWVAGAGDVNADGFSDVIVGTGYFDGPAGTDQGHAKLYLGGPTGLALAPQRTWLGDAANHYFGQCVAGIGDFDGDGYGDVAIGAFNAGTGGKVYVVTGQSGGAAATPSWTLSGTQPGAAFGNSVAGAGDVNGDGYADLLVGELFATVGGNGGEGQAHLVLGGPSPTLADYATPTGNGAGDNFGHAVAGGGDVNGDGFGDILGGEPRRANTLGDEGGFRLYLGNWRTVYRGGRARPTHAAEPGPAIPPIATYGQSRSPSSFDLASLATSAAGRDRVALDWRIVPPVGGGGAQQGRTSWKPMNPPTDPLGGATALVKTVTGLAPGSVYGWKTRVLSGSPWFRYGSWFSPQPNARGQWDVRTAPANVAVPAVATTPMLELSNPRPNPFHAATTCELALPQAGSVHAVVRDITGRTVRTIADERWSAGRYTLHWDGHDASGLTCAPGLYFLDVAAGDEHVTRRVALVR